MAHFWENTSLRTSGSLPKALVRTRCFLRKRTSTLCFSEDSWHGAETMASPRFQNAKSMTFKADYGQNIRQLSQTTSPSHPSTYLNRLSRSQSFTARTNKLPRYGSFVLVCILKSSQQPSWTRMFSLSLKNHEKNC